MTGKRSCACLFTVVMLFTTSVVLLIIFLIYLPSQAVAYFGNPQDDLPFTQRLLLSASLLYHSDQLLEPIDPAGMQVAFTIELGESVSSIAQRLSQAGLIQDSESFINYLLYSGLDSSLQAGEYRLSPASSALEIAWVLQDATPGQVIFTILPGWRAEEVARALPTSGLEINPDEFLTAVLSQGDAYTLSSKLPSEALEGFLFPGQYDLPRKISTHALVQRLLDQFELELTPEIRNGFDRQGLDIHAAIILASIVQRESVLDEEMPMIASVFLNRLAAGMPLASDPTVQYAQGYNTDQNTWWTNPLSQDDLALDSPYNTYLYPGLPPGPISNPGLAAIKAVAFPAQTPYYFFRAACDGSGRHLFAQTFEEHLNNACP